MTSITTKSGDTGKTSLFGGHRVSKTATRIHAYGTVDELNAVLGVILAEHDLPDQITLHLQSVQAFLFRIGADLATPLSSSAKIERIAREDVDEIEQWINELEPLLPQLQHFILPSGSKAGSFLHLARTMCRRAERYCVALSEEEETNAFVDIYMNRLSDYLFLAARTVNKEANIEETQV